MEYEVIEVDDVSDFPIGSELIPLDETVTVKQNQRGCFPLLEILVPHEEALDVVITRDIEVADRWVRERNPKSNEWIGYTVHERPNDLRYGSKLAYVQDSSNQGRFSL